MVHTPYDTAKIADKVQEWLGPEGVRFFELCVLFKGHVTPVFRLNYARKKIPVYPVYWREGMSVRNFMRGLKETGGILEHDFGRVAKEVLEMIVRRKKSQSDYKTAIFMHGLGQPGPGEIITIPNEQMANELLPGMGLVTVPQISSSKWDDYPHCSKGIRAVLFVAGFVERETEKHGKHYFKEHAPMPDGMLVIDKIYTDWIVKYGNELQIIQVKSGGIGGMNNQEKIVFSWKRLHNPQQLGQLFEIFGI